MHKDLMSEKKNHESLVIKSIIHLMGAFFTF